MRLTKYLESRGETIGEFARRSGVPRQTIRSICDGGGTSTATAVKIISATGGIVSIEDLVPEACTAASA